MGIRGTLTVASLAVILVIGASSIQYAYSESASTDKSHYEVGDTIRISGFVSNYKSSPVTVLISDPVGETVSVHQLTPTYDGEYSVSVPIGPTFKYDGVYTVIVNHPSFSSSEEITFTFDTGASIFVYTDKSSYNDGDTIRISGDVRNLSDIAKPVSLMIVDPAGDTALVAQVYPSSDRSFSHTVIAGGTMQITGNYQVIVTQGFDKATKTFYFVGTTEIHSACGKGTIFDPKTNSCILESTPTPFDTVPPLLLTPSDMTIDATGSSGARVDYSVKAIDDNDGILRPNCSPSSGSLFPIGKTTVTCSATDNSGNSDRKSFLITVNSPDVIIPSWIKDVAGFWCGGEIDDISFIEAIQYLINNDVIIVPATVSSGSGAQEIPNWIKSNACWWSQGLITNSDFASGLQYLIGQGIIRV